MLLRLLLLDSVQLSACAVSTSVCCFFACFLVLGSFVLGFACLLPVLRAVELCTAWSHERWFVLHSFVLDFACLLPVCELSSFVQHGLMSVLNTVPPLIAS